MNTYHFQRRGTASEWIATNPTLAAGELGLETDTVSWKVGDGATAWNSLTYILGRAELVANITWDNGNTDNTIDLSTADIPIANHYIIDCTTADPIYFISNAPDFEFKISIKSDSTTAVSLGFQSGFNGGEVKPVYPNGVKQGWTKCSNIRQRRWCRVNWKRYANVSLGCMKMSRKHSDALLSYV